MEAGGWGQVSFPVRVVILGARVKLPGRRMKELEGVRATGDDMVDTISTTHGSRKSILSNSSSRSIAELGFGAPEGSSVATSLFNRDWLCQYAASYTDHLLRQGLEVAEDPPSQLFIISR